MRAGRVPAVLALAAAGILPTALFSAAFPSWVSSTRSFSIDGFRYSAVPSAMSDFSLVRRELEKRGIDFPEDPLEIPGEEPPPHPALSFVLAPGGPDRSFRPPPIPASFAVEHTLRLGNDGEEVEITFGTTRQSARESIRLLQTRGWSASSRPGGSRGGAVATRTLGKEKLLAFLEAEGGGFLLVRRLER